MKIKLRVITTEGPDKGKVVLITTGSGSILLADGQQVPESKHGWFGAHQIEFREFSDEPVRSEEVVREVIREVPVETKMSEEDQAALSLGLTVLRSARALKNLRNARRAMCIAQHEAERVKSDMSEATETLLEVTGLSDILTEVKTEMGIRDDDEGGQRGVECPDCGSEEYLNPESGLCFDCHEDSDEDDEDESPCRNCGDTFDTIDLEDDLCEDCFEELADDEEDEDEDDEDEEE